MKRVERRAGSSGARDCDSFTTTLEGVRFKSHLRSLSDARAGRKQK